MTSRLANDIIIIPMLPKNPPGLDQQTLDVEWTRLTVSIIIYNA